MRERWERLRASLEAWGVSARDSLRCVINHRDTEGTEIIREETRNAGMRGVLQNRYSEFPSFSVSSVSLVVVCFPSAIRPRPLKPTSADKSAISRPSDHSTIPSLTISHKPSSRQPSTIYSVPDHLTISPQPCPYFPVVHTSITQRVQSKFSSRRWPSWSTRNSCSLGRAVPPNFLHVPNWCLMQ